jgi:hypothetical protein
MTECVLDLQPGQTGTAQVRVYLFLTQAVSSRRSESPGSRTVYSRPRVNPVRGLTLVDGSPGREAHFSSCPSGRSPEARRDGRLSSAHGPVQMTQTVGLANLKAPLGPRPRPGDAAPSLLALIHICGRFALADTRRLNKLLRGLSLAFSTTFPLLSQFPSPGVDCPPSVSRTGNSRSLLRHDGLVR